LVGFPALAPIAATERDQPPLPTVPARDDREASLQKPAIDILLQLGADKTMVTLSIMSCTSMSGM
jgi:hypothetical protein